MLGRHLQGTSHMWHGSTEGEGTPAFGTQYSEWVPARQRGTAREPPPPPPTESESTLDKTRGVHARQGWRRATLVPCGQDVSDVGNHLEGFSNMQIPRHRLSHSPMTSSGGAGRPTFVNQQLRQV